MTRASRTLSWLFALPLRLMVAVYQRAISPFIPARCRFYPSCSAYAAQALRDHGAVKGSALAARRLGRCHPWNPGGVDPVPPPREPNHLGSPS